ncbi:hypothetical protein SAMD00019534_033250, partial [Acytostelium subglobosum LB1]|uniref:hypothetical protein n=1 Tax=Acytostelium subglobosum LB1 TaxID=1410327 RepID=UPI0006450516
LYIFINNTMKKQVHQPTKSVVAAPASKPAPAPKTKATTSSTTSTASTTKPTTQKNKQQVEEKSTLGKRKQQKQQQEEEEEKDKFVFDKQIEQEEEDDQEADAVAAEDEQDDDINDFNSDRDDESDIDDEELEKQFEEMIAQRIANGELKEVDGDDQEDGDDEDDEDDDEDDLEDSDDEEIEGSDEDEDEDNAISTGSISSKADVSSEDEGQYNDDPNQFYETDDSEEDESVVNRVGNIPLEWYEDYDHIGYDVNGNKIMKGEKQDALDKFLEQNDPKFWRTVYDKINDKKVVLSDEDLALIKSIQQRRFPPNYNPYEDWYVPGPNPDSIHPLSNAPTPKRSFLPNMDEVKEIRRLTTAIRKGWIKLPDADEKKKQKEAYDLWAPRSEAEREADELFERTERKITRISAPKQKLPGHVESFNPPEEYLLTQNELKAWQLMDKSRRPHNFVPQKYGNMRRIPTYNNIIKERFERCLDLYLCPRKMTLKNRHKDPNHLLPKLPKPQDLRPFPSYEELEFKGHTNRVRAISVSPNGQWLASGSDDGTIKIWEVSSTRCVQTINVEHTVFCVQWNPNKNLNILAASYDTKVIIITPHLNGPEQDEATEAMFVKTIKSISWHHKGDYFSTVAPEQPNKAVKIHHLSRTKTQTPFKKAKTAYQTSKFHPSKPIFFLADQNYVRVYDLMKQQMVKKILTGCRYIASMDVHPSGDHLILGGYDKRVFWLDLDLTRPYKVLRYHKEAVRKATFHPTLPLFASCSDDLSIHVFHGMVYDDYMQNALIVPLKILRKHRSTPDGLGVLDIVFHPTQPWIFSAGADSTIRLF